ncbi:hypothetical protein CEUSTIGMA_g5872.t1 [Chlamydomonas eustigma]|uniref:J domain-containing protein n=1 Tax=Chlamydomonas eustigma TaxID=1157962 RepID=A0A250X5S8_9CHLO|nr:hypothetical protein CEUSTIGMA_g5872.t1 [Chlamydomonas eustigma]|eukprot:GAX78431.1 hypothetical protein CEUSTIGMA_g5872.t1 [Chlamydomonas eustigma]
MLMQTQARPSSAEFMQKSRQFNVGFLKQTIALRQTVVSKGASFSDASARVRGDSKRVFLYVTNVERWPEWHPGITTATRTNAIEGPHASLGAKFSLQQEIAGFKIWTMYNVSEIENNKRIVWSHSSDLHDAIDQLLFMVDPTDPKYTIVRYMSSLQLKDWRAALQPIVSGTLTKIPEKAVNSLQRLLNKTDTLSTIVLPGRHEQALRSHSNKSSPSTSYAAWVDLAAPWAALPSSVRHQRQQFMQSLGGIFSGRKDHSATGLEDGQGSFMEPSSNDRLGYYRVLGLNPETATQEDVKAAFRQLALIMHPDKGSVITDDEGRAKATHTFRKLQSAYEVLRNPDRRAAYDRGLLDTLAGEDSDAAQMCNMSRR